MDPQNTAEYWIKKLQLVPHPGHETGYLNEVFRDTHTVQSASGQSRNAGTNIYFLHQSAPPFGPETILFRLKSSELLNFYRGKPVTLYIMNNETAEMDQVVLGPDPEKGQHYFYAIPKNRWFVRRLENASSTDFALIGCTVVPGYHEDDIETKTYAEVLDIIKSTK